MDSWIVVKSTNLHRAGESWYLQNHHFSGNSKNGIVVHSKLHRQRERAVITAVMCKCSNGITINTQHGKNNLSFIFDGRSIMMLPQVSSIFDVWEPQHDNVEPIFVFTFGIISPSGGRIAKQHLGDKSCYLSHNVSSQMQTFMTLTMLFKVTPDDKDCVF